MHAHRLHPLAAGVLVLALAGLAAGLLFRSAGAQCSYTALTSGTPVAVSTSPSFYTINQSINYWTAVAVMPQSGTDWDISVWQDTYPYPGCVTTLLAGSALGGSAVDFVVGDYNFNAYGTRYVEANRYLGTGNATVEWNATNGQLAINSAFFHATFAGGASHFIYVWDVYLYAGTTYAFEFYPYGSAASHLLLFRNATGGACWKRRLDAEFDVTSGRTYVAPATGYYGVVVVNDNGASGFVEGNVEACTAPVTLASGVSQSSDLAYSYYSFDQQQNYWTAVGLRRDDYSLLHVYRFNPGSPVPGCFSDELAASSPSSSYVGVVVGDFNYNTKGTYYALASRSVNLPAYMGTVQWDDGADRLTVNGMLTNGAMSASDVVRVWDVLLYAGTSYHFTFSRSGADLRLLLFRNPAAGEYWAGRWGAVMNTTADADYTAPTSGYYGVVIVNDDGASGTYTIGVGTCSTPVALSPDVPLVTSLGENYVSCAVEYFAWTAVGVRGSDPATDWDLVMQSGQNAESFPSCRGPQLAVSDQYPPTSDFVVGDFNHNAPGYYYAWPHAYSGQGSGTGTILWAPGGLLEVNAQLVACALGPDRFLHIWDAYLTGGKVYWLRYFHEPGMSGDTLMLFRNPATGTYWAPRSSAVAKDPGGEDYFYLAPGLDYYGVAVVNDGGQAGTSYVGIGTCSTPTSLTSGVGVVTDFARNYHSITQAAPYWTAVGVRSATQWAIGAYGTGGGGQYPTCFSDLLSFSVNAPPPGVAVVAGDFNRNAFGTYYVHSSMENETEPGDIGTLEWDGGPDQIVVGAPPVNRTTGSDDVLETWDCWLAPQKYYTFKFSHTGTADVKLLIFRNTGGGTYWVGRDGAQLEAHRQCDLEDHRDQQRVLRARCGQRQRPVGHLQPAGDRPRHLGGGRRAAACHGIRRGPAQSGSERRAPRVHAARAGGGVVPGARHGGPAGSDAARPGVRRGS